LGSYGRTTIGVFTYSVEVGKLAQSGANRKVEGIPVDLDGVCTMADFEVIDIVENTSPYPTLLGLDWAFDN
jgi:hypothetical protein